jgi:hypothetical protein
MKKISFFLLSFLAITACKQSQTKCTRHIIELPCDVAFAGFSANELDTVVLTQYNAATGFVELLQTDTLFISAAQVKNGIAYSDTSSYRYKGFFTLQNRNYKVYFPEINREYKITDITSPPVADTFVTTADHCSMGAGSPDFRSVSARIDGLEAPVSTPNANNFFILIYR